MVMSDKAIHVLVIAHPDDESMFFVPTLRALKASGATVWILCLTTGDYDGLGKIRSEEMRQAGSLLKADNVVVRDTLKDHPTQRWDVEQVQREIQDALSKLLSSDGPWERIVLITFDQFGVSGHVNHIDTSHGVCEIAKKGCMSLAPANSSKTSRRVEIPVEAWTLVSERNIVTKYIPVLSWILLILSLVLTIPTVHNSPDSQSRTFRLLEPRLNWAAMTTHRSQFVWYRRLFVVFSCYTYVNTLGRIQPKESKKD